MNKSDVPADWRQDPFHGKAFRRSIRLTARESRWRWIVPLQMLKIVGSATGIESGFED
jgi:hypothetical protein